MTTQVNGWIVCFCDFFQFEKPDGFMIDKIKYTNAEKEEYADSFLYNDAVQYQLGAIFYTNVELKPYFVEKAWFNSEASFFNELELAQNFVHNLLTTLWFVKDNCALATTATAYWVDETRTLNLGFPSNGYFKADGTTSITTFNDAEIDTTLRLLEKLNTFNKDTAKNNLGEVDKQFGLTAFDYRVVYKELGRIDRALRFIREARLSNILSIKIAFYVLTLECLFAAEDGTEIKHKLGERIALYIGENYEDRLKIYKEFSEYYNIRSKYMHGESGGSYTENQLINHSVQLDSLLRKIMLKVINEDSQIFNEKDTKILKNWFNEMLFNREVIKQEVPKITEPTYPLYKSLKLTTTCNQ